MAGGSGVCADIVFAILLGLAMAVCSVAGLVVVVAALAAIMTVGAILTVGDALTSISV